MNREGRDEIFVNRLDVRHEGKRGGDSSDCLWGFGPGVLANLEGKVGRAAGLRGKWPVRVQAQHFTRSQQGDMYLQCVSRQLCEKPW